MLYRPITEQDLIATATIYQEAFVRQHRSLDWLTCVFNSNPKSMIYVAELESNIVGFIIWTQKSGFRKEAVLELELLAVQSSQQGKGIATNLIIQSLKQVQQYLREQGTSIKHVLVTTRADNYAQELYRKTLGATVETVLRDLYSADEVLMIARDIQVDSFLWLNHHG